LSLPLLLQLSLAFSRAAGLGSPTALAALEHVPVVQKPIQHGVACPLYWHFQSFDRAER
jgi:hypothetical protein